MSIVTIRNLPPEIHRALRVRAAQHGQSISAEILEILEEAVRPRDRVKLGSLLAKLGRDARGSDLDIERDKTSADPISFE